jgi:hypothetical protein
MKKLALLILVFLVSASLQATSVGLDQVGLHVKFDVSRCIMGKCNNYPNVGEDIVLNLTNADWVDGALVQTAFYMQMVSLDGHNLLTQIEVKRTTLADSKEVYELSARVGPAPKYMLMPASIKIALQNGKNLADSIQLQGPALFINGITYESSVLIQPISQN